MRRTSLIFLLLFLSLLLFGCAKNPNFAVSVLLTEGKGYQIKSENPVHTAFGGTAKFHVSLKKGLSVVQIIGDNATYKDGILSVNAVKHPETLELVTAKNPKKYKFFYEEVGNGGKLSSTVEQGWVLEGTKVTVNASLYDGVTFLGWSIKKSAKSGGEILSMKPTYTFQVQKETMLFANFNVPAKQQTSQKTPSTNQNATLNQRMIVYNTNGGTVANTGKTFYADSVSVEIYPMPNSLATPGYFVRDGYVLTQYNTKADGSGESFGLGHPIALNKSKDEPTVLYCIWEKSSAENLFEVSEEGSGLKITNYLGEEETVVVPEKIQGKPVVKIGTNAFVNKGFSKLVFPNTIRYVEKDAVVNCAKLNTFLMFDNIIEILDDSFSGTTHFQTFFLNAALKPRYTTSGNSFARKWERLVTNNDKNRVIVVSGSSTFHGLNSPMLEKELNNEYCVVNYGTHGWSNNLFYLEAISTVLHKGDIVVYAPEQLMQVMGDSALSNINYQGCESSYNMFRYVDISKYTKVFSSFTEYNKIRSNMQELTYANFTSSMNEYCERSEPVKAFNSDTYVLGANGTFYFKKGIIPNDNAQRLNVVFDQMKLRGATPVFSFPPCNINAADPTTLNDKSYHEYMDDIQNIIHIPMISNVKDYILPSKYMFNTDYHLNDAGRDLRTEQLGKDLTAFLKNSN